MVKIVNPLGDVKVGRQGEAVYQRKYGEQIRRQAAPKRAIPSEAQIAHRQLYRDALAWRKQLSLPNRRYLDGYCIANGIVDGYHIPLPWSRFALKLYLQKVGFVLAEKWTDYTPGELGVFESWTGDFTGDITIYGVYWDAHTFTPKEAHDCEKVEVLIYRVGTATTHEVILSIRNTDGTDKPTGGDLATKVVLLNTIPTSPTWIEFAFDTPPSLLKDETYAIVLRLPTGWAAKSIKWRYKDANPYPDGMMWRSSNSGVVWNPNATLDHHFKEWGKTADIAIKKATLHVKHPALLKVVHKRGGLAINGYDTLSSLDEEYLTGQVGLDVLSEDEIQATSLPGIEYKHRVTLA